MVVLFLVQALSKTSRGNYSMKNAIKSKDLSRSLTDDPKVISSMRAIQRAGLWSFVLGILIPCNLLFLVATGANPSILLLSLISLYFLYIGVKMNRLEGQASFVVFLIINIVAIANMLPVFPSLASIIPLISWIMSVWAILKMRHYLKWRKNESRNNTPYPSTVKKLTCNVNVFDIAQGELVEERVISSDTYAKFASKFGEIYAVRRYEDDKPITRLVKMDVYNATIDTLQK